MAERRVSDKVAKPSDGERLAAARQELARWLSPRRYEAAEQICLVVRREVPEPALDATEELAQGFARAVTGLLAFGIACLGRGASPTDGLPAEALDQVRRAVCAGAPEAAVLRRYVVGFRVFWTWVDDAIDRLELSADSRHRGELRRALGREARSLQHELLCLFQNQIALEYARRR
jgi:hypothetical protein